MAERELTDNRFSSEECFNLLLELLDTTTPYKHEQRIRDLLPEGIWVDKCGNAWYRVAKPDGADSETLFCCHMDTVGINPEKTDPFYHNGFIYAMSNKSSCLGGDDRCGVLCLLSMISAGIPGTYLFHVGEEKGTIGASFIAKEYKMDNFKRAIEFDRRGTTSIITVMMGSNRTCSETFAKALAKQLNDAGTKLEYKPDDTGLYTDVVEYSDEIAECTNISVGYNSEHSNNEKINSDWLITQLIPALYTVDWENLPVERDPTADNTIKREWENSRWNNKRGSGITHYGSSNSSSFSSSSGNSSKSSKKADAKDEFGADDYMKNYDAEHGFDDDAEITAIDGLTVFDEGDFFESCNFCGARDDGNKEYFFEGRFWDLCHNCKDFLGIDDALAKKDDDDKEEEEEEIKPENDVKVIPDIMASDKEEEKQITGGISSGLEDTQTSSTYSPVGFSEDNESDSSGGFLG